MIDIINLFKRLYNRIYIPLYKKKMGTCGSNVFFSPMNSTFVGGVPARVLKMRFNKEQIEEHERILYGLTLKS